MYKRQRLYYTAEGEEAHNFIVVVEDNFGNSFELEFDFNNRNAKAVSYTHLICARYTTEIRGLYQYYRIADNISYAGSKFGYIMRYSFCKTLAKKLKSSTAKVIRKYRRDHDLAIPYQAKKGETKFRIFYNDGFARQEPDKDATCDNLPNTFVLPFPTLAERLMERKCELCGATNVCLLYTSRCV